MRPSCRAMKPSTLVAMKTAKRVCIVPSSALFAEKHQGKSGLNPLDTLSQALYRAREPFGSTHANHSSRPAAILEGPHCPLPAGKEPALAPTFRLGSRSRRAVDTGRCRRLSRLFEKPRHRRNPAPLGEAG